MLASTHLLIVPTLVSISVVLLLAASLHDLAARTVPNWIPALLLIPAIVLRLHDGSLLTGLLAALGTFVFAAFCWRRGWMGGGDVKLLAAAAFAVRPGDLANFFVITSWSGAALALVYLAARHRLPAPMRARPHSLPARILRAERWRLRRGGPLPYACAIAAGALFVLL